MIIQKVNRHECSTADDVVVVIDVIRAFSTAAFAFNKGASKMILVGPIEQAFQLKKDNPNFELMGELDGRAIDGFQHSNSPVEANARDFEGKTVVFRSSSGTQGVVNCLSAKYILASSFVIAEATFKRIKELNPSTVTFVITGNPGEEDLALADYLETKLLGKPVLSYHYLERVKTSSLGSAVLTIPNFPGCSKQDLEAVMMLDHFNFALEVKRENNHFIMRPHSYD